ncbi:MAG: hypothetical protein AB7I50_24465 [Vicinamibacterales bacterium]
MDHRNIFRYALRALRPKVTLTQPWIAWLLASCDVTRWKRRQLGNGRVSLHNVKDVGDDNGTWLVWVTHTVTDEPAAIGRMNDLAGWLSSVENRALHHGSECRRKDVRVEREGDGAVNFRTLGHGRSLSDRRGERQRIPADRSSTVVGEQVANPHADS